MHLYVYLRGIIQQTELWKALAQAQWFKFRMTNKETGEENVAVVQGALRASVLGCWEYVFPKEALPEVLKLMGLSKKTQEGFKLGMARRVLGAKAVPKSVWDQVDKCIETVGTDESERVLNMLRVPGVTVHLIGIKEDAYGDNPIRGEHPGYMHELL